MTGPAELSFLDALAAKRPTPAGGAAAAYAGAMAAALVEMVARTTIGKLQYAQVERRMEMIVGDANALRSRLLEALAHDSFVFEALLAARRLPDSQSRDKPVMQASFNAAEAPVAAAELLEQVLQLALEVAESGNLNAQNDALCAAALARTAITVCVANARENIGGYETHPRHAAINERIDSLLDSCARLEERTAMVTLGRKPGLAP
jgi:formiminotetrahydrofolate cyclodeaminase